VAGAKQVGCSCSYAAVAPRQPVLWHNRAHDDSPSCRFCLRGICRRSRRSTGVAFVNRDDAARPTPDGYRGHWRVVRLGSSTRILRKAARELQSASVSATLGLADQVLKERIAMIGALTANPGWSSLLGRSAEAKNGNRARSCPPRMMRTCAKTRISAHECSRGSRYLPLSAHVYSCVDDALHGSSPSDWSFVRVCPQGRPAVAAPIHRDGTVTRTLPARCEVVRLRYVSKS
jgi:hypothetical protein